MPLMWSSWGAKQLSWGAGTTIHMHATIEGSRNNYEGSHLVPNKKTAAAPLNSISGQLELTLTEAEET